MVLNKLKQLEVIMKHNNQLSSKDIQQIFFEYLHFLPDRLGLLELEYKTIRL
jgi:hypothetical protein